MEVWCDMRVCISTQKITITSSIIDPQGFLLRLDHDLEHGCKSWSFSHPYVPEVPEPFGYHSHLPEGASQRNAWRCDGSHVSQCSPVWPSFWQPFAERIREDGVCVAVLFAGEHKSELLEKPTATSILFPRWDIFCLKRKKFQVPSSRFQVPSLSILNLELWTLNKKPQDLFRFK